MMTEIEAAWVAGLIEGEGCISFPNTGSKGYKYYTVRVTVTNTDPRLLIRLRNLVGGSIYPHSAKRKKSAWQWWIGGKNVLPFLAQIQPYLIGKREQADVAIAAAAIKLSRSNVHQNNKIKQHQAWLSRRLQELKHELPSLADVEMDTTLNPTM